jgi:hypothetical protein
MPNERKVGGVSARGAESKGGSEAGGSGRKIGGVSHKMAHEQYAASAEGPVPVSPAHGDFIWNGGPVITCPMIYATFWGPSWTASPGGLAEAARLSQFLQDLVNSQFMNVLSQYGVGSGPGYGLFMQASFINSVAANISDSDIHNIIQGAINTGAIPEPPAPKNTSHVIVVFLDSSVAVKDTTLGISMCEPSGDNAFGYHYFFTTAKGNSCYYSIIPSLDDTCLKNTGCGGGGCSLSLSQTQEQRRTQVASHEFAEMTTDPAFPSGWFGRLSDENGDICNGEADSITVGANTWDVQRTYSKTDDIATNGASFCRATAPSPIPKLTPGPSSITGAMTSALHFANYKPFLPLPNVFHDPTAMRATWDNKEVERYWRRFFYPFHHDHVVGNFGVTLRQFADIIDSAKK